jgi:hypothetical protein
MAAFDTGEGKLARIPVWVWGVIIAAVFIVIYIVRKRMHAKGDAAVSSGFDAPLEDVSGIPAQSFADQISGNYPSTGITPIPSAEKPVTNSQWLKLAFDYLVGFGKDPAMVQSALQKYLSGQSLTPGEQTLVSQALQNSSISLPPEGVALPTGTGGTPNPPSTDYVDPPMETSLYNFADQYPELGSDTGKRFIRLFGSFTGDVSALNPGARKYMRWDAGVPNKIPKFDAKYAGQIPKIRVR